MDLTKTDKAILDSYAQSLEGLAVYLGVGYEFVLHSLENLDHSVTRIINGYLSNRTEGAPITDLALKMLNKIRNDDAEYRHYTYFNHTGVNGPVKSVTISVIGENHRIIGLLCINFYMETPLNKFLESYIDLQQSLGNAKETFSSNIDELLTAVLDEAYRHVRNDPNVLSTNRNREVIRFLYCRGIFNTKDSVVHVAKMMGLSKNTVYMHLRNISGS